MESLDIKYLEAKHRNLVLLHQHRSIPEYALWNNRAIDKESLTQRYQWWNTTENHFCVDFIISQWKQILNSGTVSKLHDCYHIPSDHCQICLEMYGPMDLGDYNSESDSDYVPEEESESDSQSSSQSDSEFDSHQEQDDEEAEEAEMQDTGEIEHTKEKDEEESTVEIEKDEKVDSLMCDDEESLTSEASESFDETDVLNVANIKDASNYARLHGFQSFFYIPKRGIRRGQMCKYTKLNGKFKFDHIIP